MDHAHNTYKFTYPTLGMKTVGTTFNQTIVPGDKRVEFESEMMDLFKPYNVPNYHIQDTDCQFARLGDQRDGGYIVCQNYISNAKALINFGVQGRDNFGCALTSKFIMPNYQHDCTNNYQPNCDTNNKSNHFSF